MIKKNNVREILTYGQKGIGGKSTSDLRELYDLTYWPRSHAHLSKYLVLNKWVKSKRSRSIVLASRTPQVTRPSFSSVI